MHTLAELEAGLLCHHPRVSLACALTSFPKALYTLVDTLEILDLSNNQLDTLPDEMWRFKKLRILFLSDNNFKVFPSSLAKCPALEMIGFKANRIIDVPEHAFPKKLRWLILTDNQIPTMPASMGENTQLQKLMLAGNQLTALPFEMAKCTNLELLRISANKLETLPEWLLKLPKLSWLAFAGNPCCKSVVAEHTLPEIHWDDLKVGHKLGEGASGIISHAYWQDHLEVALKAFKGAVTSDGFPADEMSASMHIGQHDNLVEVIGKLTGHPEQKDGLLLSLIADDFKNLAQPPCLDSCTRDTYHASAEFHLSELLSITRAIASAAVHLHQRGITHGDLYGHNILINDDSECILGDFGAASLYQHMDTQLSDAIEKIEVRAFGCLLEELLLRLTKADISKHASTIKQLKHLEQVCLNKTTNQRPAFSKIHAIISGLNS